MVVPDNQEFAYFDNSASPSPEESGLLFADRGLLDRHSLFILQKATQASAEFLDIPLCIVGGVQKDRRLRQLAVNFADVNFEEIELLQDLANKLPKISLQEAFWQQVLASQIVVTIRDTLKQDQWAKSMAVQNYGIRAYAGVPLLSSKGDCLGVLMGMDLSPRQFTAKEIQFLELTARWIMSELERSKLARTRRSLADAISPDTTHTPVSSFLPDSLPDISVDDDTSPASNDEKFGLKNISDLVLEKLIGSMTQEMRNPLTSVTGMAKVLNQEVYGHLNDKQKEYLQIIYDSGRYLVSLLDELVSLRNLHDQTPDLDLAAVDIEMLCQQVLNHLELEASRRGQEFRLSVEPGDRLVLIDKSKVYQILYQMLARVISVAHPGGVVRLHVSRKSDILKMIIWVSHPWLGDGFNPIEMQDMESEEMPLNPANDESESLKPEKTLEALFSTRQPASNMLQFFQKLISEFKALYDSDCQTANPNDLCCVKLSRQDLGFLLSWELTRQHQGHIVLEGSPSSGYRYLLEFPLRIN
ncbi:MULTISPECIES: GAF domain-containing sensor histidine kinase [Planktothricoides]|uniref:histidine kinase n=2 Tax=Planktothricoides raciborskii TaxID=132608 RepID=A0AAU8JIA3_9CYAN|nr:MULTISPECIES: GAF domain-containing sensor histidine kinase [Planktothricoides]KOR34093.1 hypothetical protein AM228_26050 [Planktothricoides sp. SR001]MBD2547387.1 GAF domain-containing sensor histidine kinase [Planktothricoides raciborskii FACHB-1370]MBD2585921.1 GAF domain-containing sensor histidine kinase [Planktothricoides raciborskii FACHB-1261]